MVAAFYAGFWHYFFAPRGAPWYTGSVWSNVVAVLPLFLLGVAGFAYHHVVLKRLHESHSTHLRLILNALDPDTTGGITVLHDRIEVVADKVDETTPGGIRAVLDRLDERRT